MDLSIIIVNWNSANDIRKCLSSIHARTWDIVFEVIVVDSASFDGCGEMLEREFPQTRFIQSKKNVGFGRSNNLGSRTATGAYLLFLNPDTEVIDDAVPKMVHSIRSLPQAGCIGCRLLNSDGTLQTSCIQAFPTILSQIFDADCFRSWFPKARIWGMAPLFESTETPASTEVISGACIMMGRNVFETIGGFSDDYFMYAEDADICHKAVKSGFINYYIPTARVTHHGDSSVRKARSNFSEVLAKDSITRYFRKFHGSFYSWTYKVLITGMAFVRLILLTPSRLRFALRGGDVRVRTSWSKWKAILRWGCGLERWTETYNGALLEAR
jgi:GT2 family glycosyltransferase